MLMESSIVGQIADISDIYPNIWNLYVEDNILGVVRVFDLHKPLYSEHSGIPLTLDKEKKQKFTLPLFIGPPPTDGRLRSLWFLLAIFA